jgi:long-chain fatty acid transport protein
MKQKKLIAGALCAAASLVAQTVLGAGFGIYEGSARGNAMGTEVTADPAAPSVLYNNPAAMTGLEGTQFEAGISLINPSVTVSTLVAPGVTIETDVEDNWWTPPGAYVTHQYNDKVWMGFGVFSRFGLGVEYPDDWPGRYNVQEATIQSLDLNPSIAVKVLDNLSLAVGLRAQWFDFELYKALPTGEPGVDPDLQLHIAGDNWGIGYNLGAFFQATEWLSLGVSYDSEIDQEIEGDYTVRSPLGLAGSGGGGGDITTPAILRFGASAQATDKLTVNAGILYTMWSSYDALVINFNPALLGLYPVVPSPKDWDDVLRYQVGVEYALNETWALRAGYIFDETPDPDEHVDYIVPANDRHLLSVGVGYKKDNFFCDAGYTYLMIDDRDVTGRPEDGVFTGEFTDGSTHILGLSVGYKL